MTEQEMNQLAAYNAERAIGIVHAPEVKAKMADLQVRYDQEYMQVCAVEMGLCSDCE